MWGAASGQGSGQQMLHGRQSHPEGSPQMLQCGGQGSNLLLHKWLGKCGSRSKIRSGSVVGPWRGC